MSTDAQVQTALRVFREHPWEATRRRCKCGLFFQASMQGHKEHAEHRMRATLEASDAAYEPFCDQCAGPYTEMPWLMEQYGGHWDTCPNRAKAYLCSQEPHPGKEFYGEDGGCAECGYTP